MSFILQAEPRWTSPVTVAQPGMAPAVFKATFRLVPKEMRANLGTTPESTDELMRLSVVTLDDVVDEAGAPIPFTPGLLDALLANPWARRGLVLTYVNGMEGVPSPAAAGN